MEEVKRGRGRPRKDSGAGAVTVEEKPVVTQEEVKKSEQESQISAERKSEEKLIGWRVIGNFSHPKSGVRIGLGEGVPEDLSESDKETLYRNQKLAKITESGVMIMHKKWVTLTREQIKNFLQSPANIIKARVMTVNFYKDTLGEMFKMGNQMKVSKEILDTIEFKLGQL